MKLIDMHCDTLWKVMDLDRQGDFMENQGSISIPGMQKAGTMAQFFACFTHLEDYQAKGAYDKGYARIQEMIRFLDEQVETYGDVLAHGYSRREILENKEKGKISAVLTVEDGGVLNGDMDRLDTLYHSGVRLMTLMWNHENCLGHPNSPKASDMWQGLKPFGRQVVERMGELRMIVDISTLRTARPGTPWNAPVDRWWLLIPTAGLSAPTPGTLRMRCCGPWPTGAAWRALISTAPSWVPRQNPGSRRWSSMCFI